MFKIITLGDSGVGKASIINRYVNNTFNDNNASTVGVSFAIKQLKINKKQKFALKLMDTCGQEKYMALTKSYLKNVDGILFVFSLNDKDSFYSITEWMNLYKSNNKKSVPQILLGNKCDLKSEIEENLINEFAKNNNIKFIKTSAKNKTNINESIDELGKILYSKYKPSDNKKQDFILSYKEEKHHHRCFLCTNSL